LSLIPQSYRDRGVVLDIQLSIDSQLTAVSRAYVFLSAASATHIPTIVDKGYFEVTINKHSYIADWTTATP